MGNFYKDVARTDGTSFPAYVFIEPTYLPGGQNDQHPPHDVLKGDDLIASVYNALRANEQLWSRSLLIITWDEHGGFYDHVAPPAAVPPDHNTQEYTFDRLGVRVPTVLVSPWIGRAGSVFKASEGHLDHTSILRYLTDKHALGPLGNRTASAASFSKAFSSEPRVSGPKRVGDLPRPVDLGIAADASQPELNKNQAALIDFTRQLEREMGAAPADVGLRAIRASSGAEGEVEAAKERVRLFLSN